MKVTFNVSYSENDNAKRHLPILIDSSMLSTSASEFCYSYSATEVVSIHTKWNHWKETSLKQVEHQEETILANSFLI